jgi:sialic acid synthase SpsE
VPAIKIASGDLTYDELLEEVGSYDLPIYLSTGMATFEEIGRALSALRTKGTTPPITLLHCVAGYPPDLADTNLRTLRTMAAVFELPVGFSDHLPGHTTAIAAVALGARVLEKHVTFSRDDGHPDSPFALEIPELEVLVRAVRDVEQAMGDGLKRCMPSEKEGLRDGRRSLFAARELKAGATLRREDVAVVRPNVGPMQPSDLRLVVGRRLLRDVPAATPLQWEHFE